MNTKLHAPAHTYATPSRAIRSVEKMHVDRGGKEVRFVLSKDSRGRYFPVFIDRIKQVSDSEIEANPSANKQEEGRVRGRRRVANARKTARTEGRRAPAKRTSKVAKKATAKKAAKKTLH